MQDIKFSAGYLTVPNILFSRALGYISSNYHDLTAVVRGFFASSYPARYYFIPSLNINWTAFAVNSFSHVENVDGTAGPDVTVPTEQADFLLKHSSVLRLKRSSIFIGRMTLAMPRCGACTHQRNHLIKPRFVRGWFLGVWRFPWPRTLSLKTLPLGFLRLGQMAFIS